MRTRIPSQCIWRDCKTNWRIGARHEWKRKMQEEIDWMQKKSFELKVLAAATDFSCFSFKPIEVRCRHLVQKLIENRHYSCCQFDWFLLIRCLIPFNRTGVNFCSKRRQPHQLYKYLKRTLAWVPTHYSPLQAGKYIFFLNYSEGKLLDFDFPIDNFARQKFRIFTKWRIAEFITKQHQCNSWRIDEENSIENWGRWSRRVFNFLP